MLLITNLIFLSLGDVVDFMIGRSHVLAKGICSNVGMVDIVL